MSIGNQIGQCMMIGLQGPELTNDEADFITNFNIGGVVLFDRNIQSPEQLHKLCSSVQALRHKMADKAPLFIAIDMEGGRVHRLKPPFTRWPAIGNFTDIDSTSLAFKFSNFMGIELKAVGINLDFAPCLDMLTNPDNAVIGDRSLGTDPEHVGKMASALVRGYIKAGIIPCIKHFPGHGNTTADSHDELPVEKTDLKTLQERELLPFKKAFRARVDLCMTAHIKFEAIDPEWPVTLSEKFLQDILRGDLRYQKTVISDDLDMKALRNHYQVGDIAVRALQAGNDILLYCNEASSPPMALAAIDKALKDGTLLPERITASAKRVADMKAKSLKEPDPPPFEEAAKMIGHPDHLRVAKAVKDKEIPEDLAT